MTSNDLMTILLSDDALQRIDADVIEATAARLIRYRDLLLRARIVVPSAFMKDIEEALK